MLRASPRLPIGFGGRCSGGMSWKVDYDGRGCGAYTDPLREPQLEEETV